MEKPRAIVVHSPHSGRSAQLELALQHTRDAGVEITQCISIADLDNLAPQGKEWQKQGAELVIAAGGDGLVGGVITHIAESDLPLGILPLGTANDTARTLFIPQELRMAARVLAERHLQEIDLGVARPAEQAPHLANKNANIPPLTQVSPRKHGFFAHALTLGMNVQFARIATNVATRTRYGRMTYPFAALEVLRNHQAFNVQLRFEGLHAPPASPQGIASADYREEDTNFLSCRALQVAVINAPIFGGAWQISLPGASVSDRLLDILVIEEADLGSLSERLASFFNQHEESATTGKQPQSQQKRPFIHHPAELTGIPGLHHIQAHGVMITTEHDPRDVTLDGEIRGQTPMYVHLAEERLRVLTPVPLFQQG